MEYSGVCGDMIFLTDSINEVTPAYSTMTDMIIAL